MGGTDGCFTHGDTDHRRTDPLGQLLRKNSLCFSLFLMCYPMEAIDAVVVHELAHIRHKNHGPDFYRLVEGTLPDYRQRIGLLKLPPSGS